LGIAIIGCGAIARANAEAVRQSSKARLEYAVDINRESAQSLGEAYSCTFTDEIDEALSSHRVDVVFICTPHYQHEPMVRSAAEAGKHIIVEKPMGASLEDSRKMVNICKKAKVKLGVCYCMRYSRKIEFVKKYIEGGGLGDITGFEIVMLRNRSEGYLRRNTWQEVNPVWHGVNAKAGGGIFINNGSHYLDYLLYVSGIELQTIYSNFSTYNLPVDIEEYLSASVNFGTGGIGVITMGNSVPGCGTEQNKKITNSLQRIWGTDGHLMLIPELKAFSKRRIGRLAPNRWHKIKPSKIYNSLGAGIEERKQFVENFSSAVFEDRIPDISGEDGLRIMRIIDAVHRSGETGKPVTPIVP